MTAKWQQGHLYTPGSLVIPRSTPPVEATQAINGYFEDGDTGWDYTGGVIYHSGYGYGSPACCTVPGSAASGVALNKAKFLMTPGESISASCMIQQGASDVDHTRGYVQIYFFNSDDEQISDPVSGNVVNDGRGGAWHQSSKAAPAPASTAYARCGIYLYQGSNDPVWGDNLVVTYARTKPPAGLIYKAVQDAPGRSATTEPTWPLVNGEQVIDNEVIWEAVIMARVVWQASPILVSGATEPTWPEAVDGYVHDGTINWQAISRRVSDVKCPQSKVVAIMSSKVFAADRDIVRFSATVNPLDWSSEQDAGYLPTGLQQANANDMAVLAPYRSNLCAFNASSFQNWQVDPDPAAMAILDQMDGIGSTHQQAAQPVGTELYYLSQLGVRSVSVSGGSDSLAAGDVGMPIDVLVQAAVKAAASAPRATYYPSAGQYWLALPDADTEVFVFTLNGGKGKWSRYTFPFSVDAFAQLGNDLFIRNGDVVSKVDEAVATDDVAGVATDFSGVVWWPWLDFGRAGMTKMMEGFDYVGSGQPPSVSVGYDQRSLTSFTEPYLLDGDTLPGGIIPLPVAAPTFSIRLDFAGGEPWQVNAVELYVDDTAGQP